MKYLPLVWANLRRNGLRSILVLLSVAAAFMLFGLLDGVRGGVTYVANSEVAAKRLQTGSRLSFMQTLPLALYERVAQVDGVKSVTYASWFGGVYQSPRNQISNLAVAPNYLDLYPEILVDPWTRQSFADTPSGIMVGEGLMRRFDWRIGQTIPLQSTLFPNRDGGSRWEFTIVGTLRSQNGGANWFDNLVLMHWDYFDESTPYNGGEVGWYVTEADDTRNLDRIATAIDALSINSRHETRTRTEAAAIVAGINQMADIDLIVRSIMGAVFFTLLLLAGNSMAQCVRDRVTETAILRAIGFNRKKIFALLIMESVSILLAGGLLGLGLAGVVPFLIDAATAGFVQIPPPAWKSVILGIFLVVAVGVLAGLLPALKAVRTSVSESLNSG